MQIAVDAASSILGNDFLSPDEVLAGSNFVARDALLQSLSRRLPDEKTLKWLAKNKFIVLPTAFNDVTLESLVEKFPRIKFPERSSFGSERLRESRWLAVRKEPYPESSVRLMDGSLVYEDTHLFVPNSLTLMYAAAVYFQCRGSILFSSTYITTSSMSCGYNTNKAHCIHTYMPKWRDKFDFCIEATPSWMSERPMQKGMACARTWYA